MAEAPGDRVLPAVCAETDPKIKPTKSFIRQITKYHSVIWLSLERQQHSTAQRTNSKSECFPPILCLSSASWCECVAEPRSCPYTCFFALKRPCNGPLPSLVFLDYAILANSLALPPTFTSGKSHFHEMNGDVGMAGWQ